MPTTTVGTIPTWLTVTFSISAWCTLSVSATFVGAILHLTRYTLPTILTLATFWGTNTSTATTTLVWAADQFNGAVYTSKTRYAVAFTIGTIAEAIWFIAVVRTRLLLAVFAMVTWFAFAFVVVANASHHTFPFLCAAISARFNFTTFAFPSAVALTCTIAFAHSMSTTIFQAQCLSTKVSPKALFAVAYTVVAI